MSGATPSRRGRGGRFARRNAKRKAAKQAAAEGVDGEEQLTLTDKKRRLGDPTLAAAHRARVGGVWRECADGSGSFMVEPPPNPRFESYYQAQGIVPEGEWDQFMKSLKTKLPTTFRLSTINGLHYTLLHALRHEHQTTAELNAAAGEHSYTYMDQATGEPRTIPPPSPLVWYPNSLGWYIQAGKSELKTKGNKFAAFRRFLMAQYDQGNLNRQEAVSMIPPLLLDVKPHHYVLDMCAAPGSKTAQLLEALHGDMEEDSEGSASGDSSSISNSTSGSNIPPAFRTPSGMVIANDADSKRAYMLVHQLKRYGSSAFLVTTHDGQLFPNIFRKVSKEQQTAPVKAKGTQVSADQSSNTPATSTSASSSLTFSSSTTPPDADSELVEFDRILCDVPCSGDGTMRKNINLWTMWDPKFAAGLHALQIQIACRSLEMLRVGGMMVYSTCSFNPIENESVVAELLRRGKGAIEIVDVSSKLPGLIRQPGLSSWKVLDTSAKKGDGEILHPWADPNDESIRNGTHKSLRLSMFPPTEEEKQKFKLERCMRVLPHSQDTGGFFITLLRKTAPTPNMKNPPRAKAMTAAATSTEGAPASSPTDDETSAAAAAAQSVLAQLPDLDGEGGATLPAGLDDPEGSKSHKQAKKGQSKQEEKEKTKEKKFNEDPFEPMNAETVNKIISFYGLSSGVNHSNFFTRSSTHRKCYFVAPAIASILHCAHNAHRLKIVHTGSRCYERGSKPEDATYPCSYRIVQEGVDAILPFMTRQLIYPSFAHMMSLLYRNAWTYKEMDREGEHKQLFQDICKNQNGCIVAVLRGDEIARHVETFTKAATSENGESSSSSSTNTNTSTNTTCTHSQRSLPICVWKTPHSISIMISQVEATALLALLDPAGKFMPEEVRVKREAAKKEAERKLEERKARAQQYAEGKNEESVSMKADETSSSPAAVSESSSSPAPSPPQSTPSSSPTADESMTDTV